MKVVLFYCVRIAEHACFQMTVPVCQVGKIKALHVPSSHVPACTIKLMMQYVNYKGPA